MNENWITGILIFAFIAFMIALFAWALFGNETCAICGKEYNNNKMSRIKLVNDVQIRSCPNCNSEAFKDKFLK